MEKEKKMTFGLPFTEKSREQAEATEGFIRFIDNRYFEVNMYPSERRALKEMKEMEASDEKFVYFKRNNGEILIDHLPKKKK